MCGGPYRQPLGKPSPQSTQRALTGYSKGTQTVFTGARQPCASPAHRHLVVQLLFLESYNALDFIFHKGDEPDAM